MQGKSEKVRARSAAPLTKAALVLLGLANPDASQAETVNKRLEPAALIAPRPVRAQPLHTVEDLAWFAGILQQQKASTAEILKLDDFVIKNKVPLSQQAAYLEMTLGYGGFHERRMYAEDYTVAEFSRVMKMVSALSARLTRAYQENPTDAMFEKYFKMESIEAAARNFPVDMAGPDGKPNGLKGFCNGFFAQVRGDVYFVTASHCVVGTTSQHLFKISSKSDQAVRYIAPAQYAAHGIRDPARLPELPHTITPQMVSGRVVLSYSAWLSKDRKSIEYRPHFSVAMRLSPKVLQMIFPGQDYAGDTLAYLRGPETGEVWGRAIKADGTPGKVTRTAGSGTSGSIIAIVGSDGRYYVAGDHEAGKIIEDTCANLCYAYAFFGDPKQLNELILSDQSERAVGMLGDSNGPFGNR